MTPGETDTLAAVKVGRFEVFREIARGGMGTVHLGRMTSDFDVGRVVAIKRLHAHVASEPQFVLMFLDEARLCARIRHRNVVSLLDLVTKNDELYMVLEYVEGETLAKLLSLARHRNQRVPDAVVAGIMAGALHGLHAAHEATAEDGSPLGIVHRDFTPQNVLVGVDGAARVADFGVAKAAVRLQTTRDGQLKGKLAYMAPEQISAGVIDRRTDVFAAGAVVWEAVTQKRLFTGESEAQILMKILRGAIDPPSDHAAGISRAWDEIAERALALSADRRYATAREMALAIEAAFPGAPASQIGEWVADLAKERLAERAAWVAEVERTPKSDDDAPASTAGRVSASVAPATSAIVSVDSAKRLVEGAELADSPLRRPRSRVRRTIGVAAAAGALLGLGLGLSRGLATTTARDGAEATPSSERGASTPPSEPVAARPDETAPIVEPASASAAAPSTASAATAARRARSAPPKPAASAGCRYYDAQEGIWKFKKGCYR